MQLPLEIAARNVELSEAAEAAIRERADKLDTFYERITSCRVAVEVPHRHQQRGASYVVRVDITVPGSEFVIKRKPAATLLSAIQEAFDAAERKLRRFAHRQRGEVKNHEPPLHARVRELFPLAGYGFLETQDGGMVYFDRQSVLNGGFDRLAPGTEVRYVEERGEKGPQASTVAPVRKGGEAEAAR